MRPDVPPRPAPEPGRPRLLFVKLKHIGDALLLTPTLVAARRDHPKAEIWVVVREGTEGILAGCPAIDRMVTVSPVESDRRQFAHLWRDVRTWRFLRRQHFDYAFELTDGDRGRWLAGMSGARQRCVNTSIHGLNPWWRLWFNRRSERPWADGHRVEKDHALVSDFLPLSGEIPPLCFERARSEEPEFLRSLSDFVVLHPGTRWVKKRWPKEHWLELGNRLLERTQHLVVSCGPDAAERKLAAELVAQWGSQRATSTAGRLNWAQLAGCLHRARAFVGVDTAAMHLAAACQCPLVAIFGYSVVSQWRPWKAPCELINLGAEHQQSEVPAEEIMRRQTPAMVMAAVDRLIRPPVPS
jgi:heptosyltransferase III